VRRSLLRRLLHRPAAVEVEVAVEDTAVEDTAVEDTAAEDTALLWVVEVWVTALVEAFMAGWAEASVARL
jgi:hypothetical protein